MRVEEEEDPPQSMMLYQSPPTFPETIHNDTYQKFTSTQLTVAEMQPANNCSYDEEYAYAKL